MATGDYVLRNIFASKPLINTILVSISMLSGSMNQLTLNKSCLYDTFQDGRHINMKSAVLGHSFARIRNISLCDGVLVNGFDIHLYIYMKYKYGGYISNDCEKLLLQETSKYILDY